MIKKQSTIDDLAMMVQKGFNEISDNMVTKSEILLHVKDVNKRFDIIEKLLIEEQNRRIERLEMRIDYLENTLNLNPKT